jgi:hypothetical protein
VVWQLSATDVALFLHSESSEVAMRPMGDVTVAVWRIEVTGEWAYIAMARALHNSCTG